MNYNILKSKELKISDKLKIRNFFLTFLFFYILVLLQASFLPFFTFFGFSFNLILILVIIINILEGDKGDSGIITSFIGGFLLDIFYQGFLNIDFFGINILFLVLLSILIKATLNHISIK